MSVATPPQLIINTCFSAGVFLEALKEKYILSPFKVSSSIDVSNFSSSYIFPNLRKLLHVSTTASFRGRKVYDYFNELYFSIQFLRSLLDKKLNSLLLLKFYLHNRKQDVSLENKCEITDLFDVRKRTVLKYGVILPVA